ncbi:hypothetical protein EV361DRAFT_952785 [Lentinula raphanica]|nr:hypothetical protein F5880DRAFT_1612225 [Lentinula raphanica]KAJ3967925.1 hypothetical protein EV361DRAFT_952785 [Lentinula raphanica]
MADLLFIEPIVQVLVIIGFSYGLLLQAWKLVRWYLLEYHSGIPEINNLRKTRSLEHKLDGTAVICGGSIAGLLAARICSDFYKHVIIVEPEEWLCDEDGMRRFGWEQKHKRTRVLQYRVFHSFLVLFYRGLGELFPDLEEQCRYSGIEIVPANRNMNMSGTPIFPPLRKYGGDLPKTLRCTRGSLETLLRRLVLGRSNYPNIQQMVGTVIGVSSRSGDPSCISHVKVRKPDMGIEELDASLVVDCTGMTRAGVKWLSQAGYGTKTHPKSLQDARLSFNQKLQYSALECTVSPETLSKIPIPALETGFADDGVEYGRRLFGIGRMDGNRVLLVAGQSSDETVKYESIAAMRELVQDLKIYKDPMPRWVVEALDILEESEPQLSFTHVFCPPTTYIKYHEVGNIPSNFVAIGDSAMSVDPLYGQGCTKALLGAVVLHNALYSVATHMKLPGDFSKKFFKDNFHKTDRFWQLTRILDISYQGTSRILDYEIPCTIPIPGEDLQSGGSIRWYLRRLLILATKDEQAAEVAWEGSMVLGTPIDLFHPWIVLKIIFNTFMA